MMKAEDLLRERSPRTVPQTLIVQNSLHQKHLQELLQLFERKSRNNLKNVCAVAFQYLPSINYSLREIFLSVKMYFCQQKCT